MSGDGNALASDFATRSNKKEINTEIQPIILTKDVLKSEKTTRKIGPDPEPEGVSLGFVQWAWLVVRCWEMEHIQVAHEHNNYLTWMGCKLW